MTNQQCKSLDFFSHGLRKFNLDLTFVDFCLRASGNICCVNKYYNQINITSIDTNIPQ